MFGMGTGGSLRLLSPETKQGLDPFAAAFLLPSVRPSNGLPTVSGRTRLPLPVGSTAIRLHRLPLEALQLKALTHRVSHPQNRTGWISVARLTLTGFLNPLTFPHKPSFGFSFRSWFRFASLRFRFGSFSYSLLPVPCSLFSKIKPSTD